MKNLVIYDSFFGNTKLIAETIGKELGDDTRIIHVSEFKKDMLNGVKLLIVGSPILGWRPSENISAFLMSFGKDELKGVNVGTFDTRVKLFFHGDATKKMSEMLKVLGANVVLDPMCFYVQGKEGPLFDGELENAKMWIKTRVSY